MVEKSLTDDWILQFEALDTIRIFQKHTIEFICERYDVISDFLQNSVNNLRSNVSKNALMCLQEFTAQFKPPELEKFVGEQCKVVLLKVVYDKAFISNLAKKVISGAVTNCAYHSLIDVLVEGCKSKNG